MTGTTVWRGLLALTLCLGLSCAPTHQAGQAQRPAPSEQFVRVTIGIGEDYPQEARKLELVRRDLEVLKAHGLKVMRISFPWDAMEPEPGHYDWAFWDKFVSLATDEYHLRLLPYICYTPKWAASSQGEDFWHQPPRDNAAFADFVQRIVSRYQGRIHSWEIWNEPDNPAYWLGSVEQFERLLAAGSAAVRQADPQATVVMGGLAWNLNFLEAMLTNAPAITNIDVINLHNYYETWSDDPLEKLPDYLGRARDILRSHGKFQPLWLAEVGYSSFRKGAEVSGQFRAQYSYEHTPAHQAASVFRTLSLALASGKVSLITWYRINDLPATQEVIGDVNNRYLGLVDSQGRPKPGLRALSYFEELFSQGFECVDDRVRANRTLRSDSEVHAFRRPDGSVVVVGWLRTVVLGKRGQDIKQGALVDRRQEQVTLSLPWTAAKGTAPVYNELGESLGILPVSAQNGQTRLAGLRLRGEGVTVVILKLASGR